MENKCLFVNSRGLLKSCELHDPKPISSDNRIRIGIPTKDKTILYVCAAAVENFIETVLPTIKNTFVIVTGDSDQVVPDGIQNAEKLLDSEFLIAWVAQNCMGGHPKLHRIPIGIDYHTLATYGGHHWGPHASPAEQESELLNLSRFSIPFWKRIHRCYGTFHFNWYASEERTRAKNLIHPEVIDYQPEKMIRNHVWRMMMQYAFIPSPPGGGPDCHRTWEALVLGCVPIVKKSRLDPLYEDLPVWIVDDWLDITHESMAAAMEKFKYFTFNPRLLHLQTWVNKITRLIQ